MALWTDRMIRACLNEGGVIELHSPKTPEDVLAILSEQLEPEPTLLKYMLSPISNAFHKSGVCGSIDKMRFELHARPDPLASLVVQGTILPSDTGSTLEIVLREPELVYQLRAAMLDRYKFDLEVILDWLKSWIDTDDVTEFPSLD